VPWGILGVHRCVWVCFLGPTQRPRGRAAAPPRRSLASIGGDDVMLAMDENGWQISGAAQQLGISRPSLYKLIEAHPGIRPAGAIPAAEIEAASRNHGNDVGAMAMALKTPCEALRRHLRVLGLDRVDSLTG
jgi:hypothetical protein